MTPERPAQSLPVERWRRGARVAFWAELVGAVVINGVGFLGPVFAFGDAERLRVWFQQSSLLPLPFVAVSTWASWHVGAGPRRAVSGWLLRVLAVGMLVVEVVHALPRALGLGEDPFFPAAFLTIGRPLLTLALVVQLLVAAQAVRPGALRRLGMAAFVLGVVAEVLPRAMAPTGTSIEAVTWMASLDLVRFAAWVTMLTLLRRFRRLLPVDESAELVRPGKPARPDNPYSPPRAG